MARNLNEITYELATALHAHGFQHEADAAISDAICKSLPSYQALLTLALEAAKVERAEDVESRTARGPLWERRLIEEGRDPDDIPW